MVQLSSHYILHLFLMVPWVDLQSVIVAFSGHTLFQISSYTCNSKGRCHEKVGIIGVKKVRIVGLFQV